MKQCLSCGSKGIERRVTRGNGTNNSGLPRDYVKDEWIYYICYYCLGNEKDCCFVFIGKKVFVWKDETKSWVESFKEIVEFT
jgi:hypothetical protein